MIPIGLRVWCQAVDPDTGRFGKVDKNDLGTVRQDWLLEPLRRDFIGPRHGAELRVVEWDNDGAIDMITSTGLAVAWPYQVLPAKGAQCEL